MVIVMLTPLSENSVRQCYHYWPDEGSNLYHIYEVLQPRRPSQATVPTEATACSRGPTRSQGGLQAGLFRPGGAGTPSAPWSAPQTAGSL